MLNQPHPLGYLNLFWKNIGNLEYESHWLVHIVIFTEENIDVLLVVLESVDHKMKKKTENNVNV